MSTDKKIETTKQPPKTKAPDPLIETTKKSDAEMTEKELDQASGGGAASFTHVKQ
jgi:hypothetical protein